MSLKRVMSKAPEFWAMIRITASVWGMVQLYRYVEKINNFFLSHLFFFGLSPWIQFLFPLRINSKEETCLWTRNGKYK